MPNSNMQLCYYVNQKKNVIQVAMTKSLAHAQVRMAPAHEVPSDKVLEPWVRLHVRSRHMRIYGQ